MASVPTLELSLKLTTSDGLVEHVSSNHQFPNDEEAEDMYWAVLAGATGGSHDERGKKRGQGKGPVK